MTVFKKMVTIVSIFLICTFFIIYYYRENCSTVNLREKYLNQIENLNGVHIISEIAIDGYCISGYAATNGKYGVAIWKPFYKSSYKFESNINCDESEILNTRIIINGIWYDLFWANRTDLDFIQVIYYTSVGQQEYKFDASNNDILYIESPAKNYDLQIKPVNE